MNNKVFSLLFLLFFLAACNDMTVKDCGDGITVIGGITSPPNIPQILDPSLGMNGLILDSKGLLWIYTKDQLMQFMITHEGQASKIADWPTNGADSMKTTGVAIGW